MKELSLKINRTQRPVELLWVISLLILCTTPSLAEDDEGRDLYQAACIQCHNLSAIEKTRNGRKGWKNTVQKMVMTGAQLDTREMELVIDYLYRHHGPDPADPMKTGALPPGSAREENQALPEGDGMLLVQGYCVMCHDLGRVIATRRKASEWRAYSKDMLARNSLEISEEQLDTMVAYLARHVGK